MFDRLFRKNKEAQPEYFVALKLDESTVSACIFTTNRGVVTICGKAHESFTGDFNDAITTTDHAISKAAGEIDLSTIKKAVFGFPPYYLQHDKIAENVLPHLKKLTHELELVPSGFVVVSEAINFLLEKQNGGPQTNILVGVSKNNIIVSLFKGGKLLNQTVTQVTDRVVDTVEGVLATYSDIDIFPTKIILYGSENIESIHNQFVNYSWQNNQKFLHFPKIEILTNDFCMQAVVEAASSELSASLNFSENTTSPVNSTPTTTKVAAADLGFTQESTQEPVPQSPETHSVVNNSGKPEKKSFKLPSFHFSLPFKKKINNDSEEQNQPVVDNRSGDVQSMFSGFNKINVKTRLAGVGIILALVLLGSGYYVASYTVPKATVTLVVDPKVMGRQKEVGVNPDLLTPSEETNEIPGRSIETEVSGSETIGTTGTKLVGDPSKGTVTIYNKTAEERTFEQGLALTAGSLIFETDEEIIVPGASENVDGLTYGKASIGITAAEIGAEGNLEGQTEFTVEDFSNSSYTARNDEVLAGGTSREVSVVSAEDHEALLNGLHEELKNQAVSDLSTSLISSEHLLEQSLTSTAISRKYSSEVGSEAQELTLTLSESFRGLVYKDDDFTRLMEKSLLADIPDGYEFIPDETVLGVSDATIDKETNTVRFNADFKAKLFPKVNTDKIKSDIKGVSIDKLDSYMRTVSHVVGYDVNIESPFSLFQSRIPPRTENIIIVVEARD